MLEMASGSGGTESNSLMASLLEAFIICFRRKTYPFKLELAFRSTWGNWCSSLVKAVQTPILQLCLFFLKDQRVHSHWCTAVTTRSPSGMSNPLAASKPTKVPFQHLSGRFPFASAECPHVRTGHSCFMHVFCDSSCHRPWFHRS